MCLPGRVTNGVVAWCLEIHDLWISKAIASRRNHIEFCAALTTEDLVDTDALVRRLDEVGGIEAERRVHVAGLIRRFSGSG